MHVLLVEDNEMNRNMLSRRLMRRGITVACAEDGGAATRTIPILALTAHAFSEDRDRALASGCVGFISKPIDIAVFLAAMQRAAASAPAPS